MMGKVIMSGIVPTLVAPVTGILAGDLAVGSSVYLMENGLAVEYLVVNQGIPSGSSLYDESCDGLWLLRKNIYEKRQWHSSNTSDYANSTIHAYLNNAFLGLFGTVEQSVIKQVHIPYVNGAGASAVASGANGLSTKIFLLSGYEVGFTQSIDSRFPIDGAKLSYFDDGITDTSAKDKRVATYDNTATAWHLRSPYGYTTARMWIVSNTGANSWSNPTNKYGVRPALILPSNALFDEKTIILKGVA